jgi:hypothetical protein
LLLSCLSLIEIIFDLYKVKFYYIDIIALTLLFSIFAGIRFSIGADWDLYYYIFNSLSNFKDIFIHGFNVYETVGFEVGFLILNAIVKYVFNNFNSLLFIIALIMNFLFLKSIKQYTKYFFTGTMLYYAYIYLPYGFTILRQGIALSIAFYSIRYIYHKNLKKFLFTIFIASLFHISALCLIPFYFIFSIFNKKKYYILIFVCGIFIAKTFLLKIIMEFLGGYFDKLTYYSGNSYYGQSAEIGINFYIKIIVFIIILVLFDIMKSRKQHVFIDFYYWSLVMFLLFSNYNILVGRLLSYLSVSLIVVYTYLLDLTSRRYLKILILLLLIIFSLYQLNSYIHSDFIHPYLPYTTIFE